MVLSAKNIIRCDIVLQNIVHLLTIGLATYRWCYRFGCRFQVLPRGLPIATANHPNSNQIPRLYQESPERFHRHHQWILYLASQYCSHVVVDRSSELNARSLSLYVAHFGARAAISRRKGCCWRSWPLERAWNEIRVWQRRLINKHWPGVHRMRRRALRVGKIRVHGV